MKIDLKDLKLSPSYIKASSLSKEKLETSIHKSKHKLNQKTEAKLFIKNDLYFNKAAKLEKNPYKFKLHFIKNNFNLEGKEAYRVLFQCGVYEPFLKKAVIVFLMICFLFIFKSYLSLDLKIVLFSFLIVLEIFLLIPTLVESTG